MKIHFYFFIMSLVTITNCSKNQKYESKFNIYFDTTPMSKQDTTLITYENMEFYDGIVNGKFGYYLYTWSDDEDKKIPIFESTNKVQDMILVSKKKTDKNIKSLIKIKIKDLHE